MIRTWNRLLLLHIRTIKSKNLVACSFLCLGCNKKENGSGKEHWNTRNTFWIHSLWNVLLVSPWGQWKRNEPARGLDVLSRQTSPCTSCSVIDSFIPSPTHKYLLSPFLGSVRGVRGTGVKKRAGSGFPPLKGQCWGSMSLRGACDNVWVLTIIKWLQNEKASIKLKIMFK